MYLYYDYTKHSGAPMKQKALFATLIAVTVMTSSAEIVPNFSESGLSITLKNETNKSWMLGGIRFQNRGFQWSGLDNGYIRCHITNTPIGDNNQVELYFDEKSSLMEKELPISINKPFTHRWTSVSEGSSIDSTFTPEILLKTGAAGAVLQSDVPTASAISLGELRTLQATSNFYNSSYRYAYTDSLGVNGGEYSSGFLDSWIHNNSAETQMQIAYPTDTFTLNNFDLNIDTSATKGPMYWMSLAMAQEYFNIDLQLLMVMGIKENNAGVAKQHFPNDIIYDGSVNHSAGYGPCQIEAITAIDRALSYPHFFPKYAQAMSNARDVMSFINDPNITNEYSVLDYYCGDTTEINSAKILNTLFLATLAHYSNYDAFVYSTDICWKEALPIAKDPYMGLGALLAVYVYGNSKVAPVAGDLNSSKYEATSQIENAHLLWGTGLNNYIPIILNGVQNFTDASQLSQSEQSVEILDHSISERELLNIFFGDEGTVGTQGPGGLLRHYYDNSVTDCNDIRSEIWQTLTEGFAALKSKSPSTINSDKISLRYDFLSLIRTVKNYFPFERGVPSGGDIANIIIPNNSGNYLPCNEEIAKDSLYPSSIITDTIIEDRVAITVKATDDTMIKDVQWCLDSNWSDWNQGKYISGSGAEQIFEIELPKEKFETETKAITFWYMVRDENYNSVVRKVNLKQKVSITEVKTSLSESVAIKSQKGLLILQGIGNNKKISVALYNLKGQQVQKMNNIVLSNSQSTAIKTAHIPSGVYIIKIKDENSMVTGKLSLH